MLLTGLKKIGHRFLRIALGEKNLCPFNGVLSIESLTVDEAKGKVFYTVKFESGLIKHSEKSIEEAEALGWITKRVEE